MNGRITIGPDEYIGAVKLQSQWRFFYDILSMWILDYDAYDPEEESTNSTSNTWRYGIRRVNENNAEEYCRALEEHELSPDQIPHVQKDSFPGQPLLTFVVNFDERVFVNGWHDNIPIHDYVPSDWKSVEDDPYEYIPSEFNALWEKLNSQFQE